MAINIPYKLNLRKYQVPVFRAVDNGFKRIFLFVHRRAGKDKCCVNLIMKRAIEVVGLHYYFFPTHTQGRKIVWDNPDMMQHFPKELIKSKNSVEMKITLTNGSVIQFIGTDNADSVRGTNPITCIFSEFAFHNPIIWDIVRPILNENGGIAIFQTTPNGDNHASEMFDKAKNNKNWFTQVLTVDDTIRDSIFDKTTEKYMEPVITAEDIEEERRMGMSDEMIRQEYYCDRKVGKIGAYWANQINNAENSDRIGVIPIFEDKLVNIYSDLGISDSTALFFEQDVANNYHFVNHYEANNKGIDHYFSYIDSWLMDNNCKLGILHLPHDGKKRDLTSGVSVYDLAIKKYGFGHVKLIPIASKQLQIDTARGLLPYCSFHEANCSLGIKALKNYHKEFDQIRKVFRINPDHDWSSHTADSFQNFAMAKRKKLAPTPRAPKTRSKPKKYDIYD